MTFLTFQPSLEQANQTAYQGQAKSGVLARSLPHQTGVGTCLLACLPTLRVVWGWAREQNNVGFMGYCATKEGTVP